jgi:cell division transport system permease protein
MKYLKSHLFLVFALVSILFSIEVYYVFTKAFYTYEKKIADNYAVIVVSKAPLIKLKYKEVAKIEPINIEKSLTKVKSQLQNFDISNLKSELPYFYRVYFKSFPSPSQVRDFKQKLLQNKNIQKVENFALSQEQIYNLMLMIKLIISVFMVIIAFVSFLLMIKQLEVWKLEHKQRMYIMELFGAPFWFRSAVLLRLAIVDSFVSVAVVFMVMVGVMDSEIYQNFLSQLGIKVDINIYYDLIKFLIVSLAISLLATFIVIFSKKDESI